MGGLFAFGWDTRRGVVWLGLWDTMALFNFVCWTSLAMGSRNVTAYALLACASMLLPTQFIRLQQ